MNCSVCGGPLLFSRVAFHCSCGAYIHAYCLDKHIVLAHRPEFEEGTVDLNGDFHSISEKAEVAPAAEAEADTEAEAAEETGAEVQTAGTGMEEETEVGEGEETTGQMAEPVGEESGFVEVDTVSEEEKLESGDVGGSGEERPSETRE